MLGLKHARTVILVAFVIAFTAAALAQEPPFHRKGNIEITVLFPAGSSADVTARLLAQGMTKFLGASVIIVNRPGAAGAIGYRYLTSQKADGYALVWNSNSVSTAYHSGQMPMDYRAFQAIARVLIESPLLVVRADARWRTLADFIKDAQAHPGKLTVANSGTGSHTHLSSIALFKSAGAEVVDVPYGATQVVPSLIGGHIDAMMQLPGAVAPHIKSGALRAIATLTAKRDPELPDVPTAKEQGFDVVLEAWRGIAAPKGTPPAVVAQLEAAMRQTSESQEFIQGSERLSVHPAFLPAAEFGAMIAREDVEIERIMSAVGLKKQQ
jgi:tripartite-type tricarboxylate transporter receptor subunit TctC